MNGIVASLLVSGENARSKDIVALKKKMARLVQDYAVEVIVYSKKKQELPPHQERIIFTYTAKIPSVQKAIVVSSGEILLFSTLKNFLADKKNSMLNQALNTPVKHVALSLQKSILEGIGINVPAKIPYIVAKKKDALDFVNHIASLSDILKYIDPQKVELLAASARFSEHVARNHFLESPEHANIKKSISKKVEFKEDIPTFIISRDRLEPLKHLVKWCEDEGLKNIILIDNASTYPPLRKYLDSSTYEVIYLAYNVGYLSPWATGAVQVYAKDRPYIVSDSDIVPLPNSHGAVKLFCRLLNKYKSYVKAGFGLKIDDIPVEYEPRNHVIAWEKKFWQKEIEKDVYDADIDTTFALWRPNLMHTYGPSLRTGGKYVAKHDTWYMNSKKLPEEMRYYRTHADRVVGTWGTDTSELPELYTNK